MCFLSWALKTRPDERPLDKEEREGGRERERERERERNVVRTQHSVVTEQPGLRR